MSQNNSAVTENIQSNFENLFFAEQKVARYVLDHIQEVPQLNVSELASRSKTSDATVVRTAKHLGYAGYYEMRLLVSRDIGKIESQTQPEKLSSSQKLFSAEADRIASLSDDIDFESLLTAGRIILAGRAIHIVAVGNTIPVALDLGFRLERAGVVCTYSMLAEHYYNHINLGNSDDVVLAISRSGASRQVIRAVELAHKKGMRTVIVTGEKNHTLIDGADCVLQVKETAPQLANIGNAHSHLIEFAVNDVLLYIVRTVKGLLDEERGEEPDDTDQIGILLSEFKL